jgi:hemoglobin
LTSSYFSGVDMRRLIDHQTKFISTIMGGPASYSDDALERVHARIGITEEAFDAAAEMLMEAFEDFGIEDADVKQLCAEFVSRKRYIVAKA